MGSELVRFHVESNGFQVVAEYDRDTFEFTLKELMERINETYARCGTHTIVFLVAPGGTGKTTLSKIIECEFNKTFKPSLASVGIDGFHYKNSYLESHFIETASGTVPLKKMKGFYNTYDTEGLEKKILSFKNGTHEFWPSYSRISHDVIDDSIRITSDILLLEGNWLLDPECNWAKLRKYCDLSIFIRAPKRLLHERLVSRKVRGGLSVNEAEQFYRESDMIGVDRVLNNHLDADINLVLGEDGTELLFE